MTRPKKTVSPPSGPLRLRETLLGQDAVLARLSGARRENRLAHAYLLLGRPGVGKTRTALALAQELLCGSAEPPCGVCSDCKQAARAQHPDLYFLYPATKEELSDSEKGAHLLRTYVEDRYALLAVSGAASLGIDQIRQLKERIARARVQSERRVVIMTRAERMTEQAAQSSLKLLEEPPSDTVLLLTAPDASSLLPTIVSRCQSLRIPALSRDAVTKVLEETFQLERAEARLLASLCEGSLGRAIELKDEGVRVVRDEALRLLVDLEGASGRELERRVQAVASEWDLDRARLMVDLLVLWHRDLLAQQHGVPEESITHLDRLKELREEAGRISVSKIRRRVVLLEELIDALEHRVNPELALHVTLARIGSGGGDDLF